MAVKNIGIDLKPPEKECNDVKCAWHGKIKVRGKLVEGIVVSVKPQKTVIIEIEYAHYLPKYERYERRHSRLYAHLPPCINVKEGDKVIIGETRKLSKTKAFVVLQKVE
ncbi:MAG: 30S ribosomal protein S17 [Candidatus Aenigmatarchaeota archaeon]